MPVPPLSRRHFLLGLGAASAAAAAGLSLGPARLAHAGGASTAVPKRILFYWGTSGSFPGLWEPRAAAGMAQPTLTEWDVGELHAPLREFRDRLIYFENLDMVSKKFDATAPANAHIAGETHALTGASRRTDRLAGGASIDQFIAQRLNSPAPVTRLPSLELIGEANGDQRNSTPSVFTDAAGNAVPAIWNPRTAYERVFPGAPDNAARDLARRARVAAYVQNRFSTLNPRLPAAERALLDEHQTTLADLQRRLALGSGRASARPPASILDPLATLNWNYNATPSVWAQRWRLTTELNLRIAVAALHADVTRVASIAVSDPPNEVIGYRDGELGATDWHDLIHKVMNPMDPVSRDPNARAVIRRLCTAHVEMFAMTLRELAMRTEPDGSSLLDHTLVVFVSQIADGSHSTQRLPWLVAGNAGGYFRTGRYVRFARRRWTGTDLDSASGGPDWTNAGRPHNDLFISLANAMDIPITTFGEPRACTGPIAEMRT